MALEKWHQQKFDALVTDLAMPKIDGFQLIAKIRMHDYLVPIIIYSMLSTEEHKRKGQESGATSYIIKSQFSQDNLVKILKDIFGKSL